MVTGGEHLKVFTPEENGSDTSLEEILAEYTGSPAEEEKSQPEKDSTPPGEDPPTPAQERKVWVWRQIERSEKSVEGFSDGDSRRGSASTPRENERFSAMTADTTDLANAIRRPQQINNPERRDAEIRTVTPEEAARLCEKRIAAIRARMWPLTIIAAVMALITLSTKLDGAAAIFGQNLRFSSAMLLVLHLSCCALGLDVILRGVKDILILQPRTESVIAFACLFSALHAIVGIVAPEKAMGLPFCAVGSCAVLFFRLGLLAKLRANRTCYKLYLSSGEPQAVIRRSGDWDGGDIIIKQGVDPNDFVESCTEEDGSQRLFTIACPAILILVIVSSLIVLLYGRGLTGFLRALASLSCACAAFSSSLCYALPLRKLNKVLQSYGAAVTSWTGAKQVSRGGGVVITDSDLFPPGKAALSGMKIIGPSSVEWVLSVSASVIDASGSELARPFLELMREQGGTRRPVENLHFDNSGGYVADVQGCHIYIGSSAFMRKQEIELYSALMVKKGIYLAINRVLTAVFIINYSASPSIAASMRILSRKPGFKPILALKDFLIDREMIEEEFLTKTDRMFFPDLTESGRFHSLADSSKSGRIPSGIICREGLTAFACLLIGCRKLTRRTILSCLLALGAAVLGLEFMFFLGLSGSYSAASAANLLIYNLLWLLPTFFIGSGTGRL
ncbi:MAG: hypothetical protein GXX89_01820 [Clostridiales bacterium]|jgi:hypothetical protein|nr:hypothetical protein [Clostridiales bacterium]